MKVPPAGRARVAAALRLELCPAVSVHLFGGGRRWAPWLWVLAGRLPVGLTVHPPGVHRRRLSPSAPGVQAVRLRAAGWSGVSISLGLPLRGASGGAASVPAACLVGGVPWG